MPVSQNFILTKKIKIFNPLILAFLAFQAFQHSNAQDWQMLNSGTTNQLRSVFFKNADTGFVVGAFGTFLKTVDGGLSWSPQSISTGASLYSIAFPDPSTGYIAGDSGIILKTTNGGINWIKKFTGFITHLSSVFFVNENIGYATGDASILKTTNGGNTWNNTPPPGNGQGPESVCFTDSLTGYIAGSYWGEFSLILKTTDGGITWTYQSVNVGCPLHSAFFTSKDTGIIVGGYYIGCWAILRTNNGGLNWNTISSGFMGDGYSSVFFTGINEGYIVGESGIIKRSSDGGSTWQNLYSGTTRMLFSVYFPDPFTGYAIGDSGTILKTTNGGGVGIGEKQKINHLEIYPNPALDQLTVELTYATGSISDFSSVSIFGMTGQELFQQKVQGSKSHIDVSKLSPGLYFIRLVNKDNTEYKKFVRE
jgi:photosystem II stability/assembly factor-like uncharacterized protein